MAAPSNLKGIAFLLAGAGVFVLNDSLMKLALSDAPPFQVLSMRGIAGCLWALPVLAAMGALKDLPRALDRWVILRALLEVVAIMAFIVALARVPIGDITAIFQITPLLIVVGMAVLHGEHVGPARLALIGLGFAGALMVAQPGAPTASPYALLGFVVALAAALRDLAGRRIPQRTPVLVSTFATIVLVMGVAAAWSFALEDQVAPTGRHLLLMGAAGLLVMLGHMFTFLAYRHANAQAVAPFYYSFMIWAVIAGAAIFGDWPNMLAFAGMALILASGLAVVYLERRTTAAQLI
jgi:drug/metabolite transporter (DMT)-like permease